MRKRLLLEVFCFILGMLVGAIVTGICHRIQHEYRTNPTFHSKVRVYVVDRRQSEIKPGWLEKQLSPASRRLNHLRGERILYIPESESAKQVALREEAVRKQ